MEKRPNGLLDERPQKKQTTIVCTLIPTKNTKPTKKIKKTQVRCCNSAKEEELRPSQKEARIKEEDRGGHVTKEKLSATGVEPTEYTVYKNQEDNKVFEKEDCELKNSNTNEGVHDTLIEVPTHSPHQSPRELSSPSLQSPHIATKSSVKLVEMKMNCDDREMAQFEIPP